MLVRGILRKWFLAFIPLPFIPLPFPVPPQPRRMEDGRWRMEKTQRRRGRGEASPDSS